MFKPEDRQIKVGDDLIPFNAFTLLDPRDEKEQIFYANHLGYGMYHAGVVCNDVDTNSELV